MHHNAPNASHCQRRPFIYVLFTNCPNIYLPHCTRTDRSERQQNIIILFIHLCEWVAHSLLFGSFFLKTKKKTFLNIALCSRCPPCGFISFDAHDVASVRTVNKSEIYFSNSEINRHRCYFDRKHFIQAFGWDEIEKWTLSHFEQWKKIFLSFQTVYFSICAFHHNCIEY